MDREERKKAQRKDHGGRAVQSFIGCAVCMKAKVMLLNSLKRMHLWSNQSRLFMFLFVHFFPIWFAITRLWYFRSVSLRLFHSPFIPFGTREKPHEISLTETKIKKRKKTKQNLGIVSAQSEMDCMCTSIKSRFSNSHAPIHVCLSVCLFVYFFIMMTVKKKCSNFNFISIEMRLLAIVGVFRRCYIFLQYTMPQQNRVSRLLFLCASLF